MKDFVDKTSTEQGTFLNRANMMAIQGFIGSTTVFNDDGSITQTNSNGEVLTTTFNDNGTVTEVFVGEKTITKNIEFMADGSIKETIS